MNFGAQFRFFGKNARTPEPIYSLLRPGKLISDNKKVSRSQNSLLGLGKYISEPPKLAAKDQKIISRA